MTIHLYGFLLGLAIVSVISCAEWVLKRAGKTLALRILWPVVIWMTMFGVVGARAYHVATDLSVYEAQSFTEIFKIWNGGLGIFGAVFGAMIGLLFALWRARELSGKNILIFIDAIGFGWPLGQAIGRWGNFFNHELYGKPVDEHFLLGLHVPFQFRLPGYEQFSRFHPLFLYESMTMFIVWLALYIWLKKTRVRAVGTGKIFGLVCVAYALVRFVLEPLRIAPNIGQEVSLLMLGIGTVMIYKRSNEKTSS